MVCILRFLKECYGAINNETSEGDRKSNKYPKHLGAEVLALKSSPDDPPNCFSISLREAETPCLDQAAFEEPSSVLEGVHPVGTKQTKAKKHKPKSIHCLKVNKKKKTSIQQFDPPLEQIKEPLTVESKPQSKFLKGILKNRRS